MKREEQPDSERPDAHGKKVAIVVARFYPELADQLLDGARRAAIACGVAEDDLHVYKLPGCFELPSAAQRVIRMSEVHAIAALGVIVRGETPHFDYVAGECSRGLMTVSLQAGTPIGFGILTVNTIAEAEERADPARGDKGYEAMIAALSVLSIAEREAPVIGFRGSR